MFSDHHSIVNQTRQEVQVQQSEPSDHPQILHLNFNQDNGCFICTTQTGFLIYNADPLERFCAQGFNGRGIGYGAMLFRTNLSALVGGGTCARYPPNKIMMWDDAKKKCVGEIAFRNFVRAVKLRRDRIVAVLTHHIIVYEFTALKRIDYVETGDNLAGLCAITSTVNPQDVLAYPGTVKGKVHCRFYKPSGGTREEVIKAHKGPVVALALSADGDLLATASDNGTVVRIFRPLQQELLHELRRGIDNATIYSLSFHPTKEWFACSSDKGTVHVWRIVSNDKHKVKGAGSQKNKQDETKMMNPLSTLATLLTWSGETRSCFQYHLHDKCRNIIAFGDRPGTLLVVSYSGFFYKASFDPASVEGECTQDFHSNFMAPVNDNDHVT